MKCSKAVVVIGLLVVMSLVGCRKEVAVETEPVTVEATTEADLDIRISVPEKSMQGISIDEDGNIVIEEAVVIETQPLAEQLETIENGDIMDKARANEESLQASEEESRESLGETLSEQEAKDKEVITEEEMVRLNEEFQNEIDEFNLKQYESMMAEWE